MRETLVDAIVKHCRIGIVVLLLALGGCAQLPQPSVVGEQESVEIPQPPPALSNGSIYQAGRGQNPLFEDRRPRAVGDVLTVMVNEQVSASKSSQSHLNPYGESDTYA